MVNARIHIICGNCGNDEWTLKVNAYGDEVFDEITGDVIGRRPSVALSCGNCATLYFLDENLMERVDE